MPDEVHYFICQNCLWTADRLIADMENVVQVQVDQGTPEPAVNSLLDFSAYVQYQDVLVA